MNVLIKVTWKLTAALLVPSHHADGSRELLILDSASHGVPGQVVRFSGLVFADVLGKLVLLFLFLAHRFGNAALGLDLLAFLRAV